MNLSPNILAIGSHDSGKTTYRAQLISRLDSANGRISLAQALEDASHVAADIRRLNAGLQPQHTNASVYHSTRLHLKRDSQSVVLDFPDYGGEQVNQMFRSNAVPLAWAERLRVATAWLLFLRIDRFRPRTNSFVSPTATSNPSPTEASAESGHRDTELEAIELLQRFLFVAGVSLRLPTSAPRLAILLSCWDELHSKEDAPEALLESRAPLLNTFVLSNWRPSERRVWALSSTERPLPMEAPDREFATLGPEAFGYIISGTGTRSRDLTEPISWLLGDS